MKFIIVLLINGKSENANFTFGNAQKYKALILK